jgi:hypothetical protein
MTSTKATLLRLALTAAAATVALGAAQACGPMGGGESGGGGSAGGPPPSSSGGSPQGGGGWDNGGAEQMRQGAEDTARGDAGDDSGGRRSPGGGSGGGSGGGASQDYSSQITSLGAAEAKEDAQAAQATDGPSPDDPKVEDELEPYDGHTGGWHGWWAMLTGADEQPPIDDGGPHDPKWQAQMDKPWYQRWWEGAQALAPKWVDTTVEDKGTGGWNGWWGMLTGDDGLEHSLIDNLPKYEDPSITPEWRAWKDLPWYQRWEADEPPMYKQPLGPRHTPSSGSVRG